MAIRISLFQKSEDTKGKICKMFYDTEGTEDVQHFLMHQAVLHENLSGSNGIF